jgi:hypothetical protein
MVKFDNWLNVEAIYTIQHRRGRFYCDCPHGGKNPTCKHRDMIAIFCQHKAVNSGRFYCHETGAWKAKVTG